MSKVITAEARITATDATGKVFDALGKKIEGVAKSAKSIESIKPFERLGWGQGFQKEIDSLKLSARELDGINKSWSNLHTTLNSTPRTMASTINAMGSWKRQTLANMREVKAASEETEKAHVRYLRSATNAGRFAMHAVGIGGAAYAVGHGIHKTAEAYGQRGRAIARYEQMGLSDQELAEGQSIASAISNKFPSISRTEVLNYLRTNASRLGSWERSKEVAEPFAQALIANKLSGGDEHEMEQVVRALEGMGKANTPAQIVSGLNAFSRAKAANPDYTGEQFRSDMAAAAASKYGLSKDYMENVFPILASHTSGFGNKLATGMSALIGGRMKTAAKKNLEAAGLMKDGKLIDQDEYIANNFEWTQRHVKPLLEARGIRFGEDMSEEDKAQAVKVTSGWFSHKNAQDLILTNLLDAPLIERARNRHTAQLEDMQRLQTKDPILAYDSVITKLKDVALAFGKLGPVLDAMNGAAEKLGNLTRFIETGKDPGIENFKRAHRQNWDVDNINEKNFRDNIDVQLRELDGKLLQGWGMDDQTRGQLRIRQLALRGGKTASENMLSMSPTFSDDEIATWQEQGRELRRGRAYHDIRNTDAIPFPQSRPAGLGGSELPPAQTLEGARPIAELQGSAEVRGEVKQTIVIEASEWFRAKMQSLEDLIKMTGVLRANGPGSNGQTSPDAHPGPGGRLGRI